MRIKSVMTPCPYVINADMAIDAAIEQMKLYSVRHLPVIKNKELIGVISERDMNLGSLLSASVGHELTVEHVCGKESFVVNEEEDLADVAREMSEDKHEYALITNDEDKFTGIFTTNDATRVVYMLLQEKKLSDGE